MGRLSTIPQTSHLYSRIVVIVPSLSVKFYIVNLFRQNTRVSQAIMDVPKNSRRGTFFHTAGFGKSLGTAKLVEGRHRPTAALRDFAWLDPELLHTRDERGSFDAHSRGGTLRTGNSTVGLLKDARDLIAIVNLS
jgi:hypothetical protein